MKHARKLASLLLALVMVFALATTAFATEPEGTTTTPTTGSITVDNPVADRTYTAYKIFDVVYDTNGANGHYSYTIKGTSEWFETVKAYADGANSGLTLTEVLGTTTYVVTTTSDFSAPPFAEALKAAVNGKTGGITLTEDNGKATATDLDLGYYFVTSTSGALCNLTTTNSTVTIHDKNDMPFEKKVDRTNVDVGQTVKFTITGKVPDYTGFETYTYEIADTMSEGLTFNRNSLAVKVGSADVTADTDKCTIAYDAETAPNTFKVTILVKNCTVGDAITVTYTATVNEKAIAVVSKNEAKLTYSNDPTDSAKTTNTPVQKQEVYTSKIVIDKYETDKPGTKLPGAEFVLCRKAPNDEAQYAAVQNNIKNTNKIQYYRWDEATKTVSWVDDIDAATKVTTDNKGEAFFEGLADGTYYLVETKAPAGYNPLTAPVPVTVAGSSTDITKLSVTAKVENQAGTLLPSTGGVGTTVFYVLGAVLVLGAVVLLVTKKRMSRNEG